MSQDDDWVQRALAWAREEESLPDDVAARLDARLEELSREDASASVIIRPRRRVGPLALAAAAVAAVVAVAVPVVRHAGSPAPSGTASSAHRDTTASPSPSTSSGSPGIPVTPSGQDARLGIVPGTVRLRSASFHDDVEQHLSELLGSAAARDLGGAEATSACAGTPAAGTRTALVLLDGRPALLEISAPSNGVRTVRALSCDDAAPVASTTLSAP